MITNKYNIPKPIYDAVNTQYKPQEDRFSVTDLIGPVLIRRLKIEHWDDLVEDASDRMWMLLGSAVDHIISKQIQNTAFVQQKIEIPIDGAIVVGKPDIFYPQTGRIEDWKVTSVWSFLLGNKTDWEKQLNCYAWLVRHCKYGIEDDVKTLTINAILRDWQKSKMLRDKDYPRIPFVSKEIPLWTFEEQQKYIEQQLEYHRMAEPEECSPEDKWEKPTTYAVMKKGRKSALRVLDNEETASQWCLDNDYAKHSEEQNAFELNTGIEIVERPGECVRCENYCPVRMVCKYRKEI